MSFNIRIFYIRIMDSRSIRRKRIFDIIQIGQREDTVSRLFDYILVCVIITNIIVMFLETFSSLSFLRGIFGVIEVICIVAFCIEYILRIYTADFLYPKKTRGKAIWKFITSFDGIVELLTILPFFFLSGFVVFRMLRVVRIFHLFRINNSYDSFNVITSVLYHKRNQIVSSVFILFILMLSASLCMYAAEHDVQPEAFDNAFSGLWWSISTILTVGYGDIYPVTVAGRILAIIIAILGVGVVAIPTGIISAGFVEQYTDLQREKEKTVIRGTITLNADESSPLIGMGLDDLYKEYNIVPLVIIRDGIIVIPTDDVVINQGDTICYHTEDMKV